MSFFSSCNKIVTERKKKIKCSIYANGYDEIGWNEVEPIPSVRLKGQNTSMTGWSGADLSQNYTMLHDGFVNTVIDDNGTSIIITDLDGNETTISTPTLHNAGVNTWCFFLPKGYKVRLSRDYYADFMSIQYYLKRD